jgi:hypothetical protein
MTRSRPRLHRRLVTLNLDNEEASRLDRLAAPHGQNASEFVSELLRPLLQAENGEENLFWFLCALNGPDHALLGTHCRKRGWNVDEVLDILIGNALEHLNT